LLLCLVLGLAKATACTAACDAKGGSGSKTVFCGSDKVTYNATRDAVVSDNDCYASCGVSVLYVGPCGCPNFCGNAFARGACSGGRCVCKSGWGGEDCMSVSCPHNACSGHGSCSAAQQRCLCSLGFTGPACETQVPAVGVLPPWTQPVVPGPPQYSPLDPYGDNHPVFNLSSMPTVRITLPEDALLDELYPFNLFNDSYADGEMSFFSESVQMTGVPIGIRPKGMSTRTDIKKPWDIKFKGKGGFFGLKKVGIKNGNGSDPDDDSVMKAVLTFLFGRAVGIPVSRTGFLALYLNSRYQGKKFFYFLNLF
jgi:hypothetical protein